MWRLLLLLAPALGFHLNQEAPPPAAAAYASYETGSLNVRVNHFDATNTDTFPMRFFFNRRETGARNIVIVVGGQGEITPEWVTGGLGLDIAGSTGASLFYPEHRYYGLTRPTTGTSVPELRFLTADQVLADLAQFITYVKSAAFEQGIYRSGKVLLAGCSYAGTLASWMRVQYPHLVDGVLNDSGPLQAQEDFPEYMQVVGEAIAAQGGAACYSSVQQSISQVAQLLSTTNGRAQVSQMFNTCTPLTASALDIATFHRFGPLYAFAGLVENATPGQIPAACAQLTNGTADPVQRLASWVRQQLETSTSSPCIETRYSELVARLRNTSFDSEAASLRAWTYQTCAEFGWHQTTSGSSQPFGAGVPLTYFHQMCTDFFSPLFDATRNSYGVSRTNLFFGGRRIPDRVVTVAGQLDPWHPMGPNGTHSRPQAPVYFVPDISRCRIMYSLEESETEAVRDVKLRIIAHMNEIVYGVPASVATRAIGSVALLLGVLLNML